MRMGLDESHSFVKFNNYLIKLGRFFLKNNNNIIWCGAT